MMPDAKRRKFLLTRGPERSGPPEQPREPVMLVVAMMLVGAVVAWLVVDQWLLWRKEQMHAGASAWREQSGPGSTFHASGFEDTHPPHELVDLRFGQPANAIHHKRAA